jgi:hypothetical protein
VNPSSKHEADYCLLAEVSSFYIASDSRQEKDIYSVKTGSGAHIASYPVGTGGTFPGVKRSGREAYHSLSSGAEVKNGGATPPLPILLP